MRKRQYNNTYYEVLLLLLVVVDCGGDAAKACPRGAAARLFYQAPATVPQVCFFAYAIRLKITFVCAIINNEITLQGIVARYV